jgi:hypothetical protein
MDILIKNFIFIYHVLIKNGSVETAVLYCSSGPLLSSKNSLCAYDHLLQPPIGLNNVDANWIEEEETTQVGKQEIDCKVQINLGLF